MKNSLLVVVILIFLSGNVFGQTQTPGLDILGYGYDVFGNYADQASKKKYCLFNYTNFTNVPIGSNQYSVPEYVFLENISKHKVSTVSGESMREYSKSQSASVGLGVDGMFFSASINTSFSESNSGSVRHYYYTYRDANTKWRISFDERDYDNLDKILNPRFKQDLATMDPAKLFDLYGTHYISSAYLGGRADYNTVSDVSSSTKTSDIAVAVEASYGAVNGSASVSESQENTLKNSKTKEKLTFTGGNSEFANNISDPVAYQNWASGIAKMPVLCDFDKNSLKPIWNFCVDPKRKEALKAEFAKMVKAHPLPPAMSGSLKASNQVFFVSSEADGLYIDLPGYHFDAQRKNGTAVSTSPKDNQEAGLQGIDRFIKVIPHAIESDYVFLQPQNSDLVLDVVGGSTDPGTVVHLWDMDGNNVAQMFKLVEVDGKKDTYFLENKNSKLYLTSHGNGKQITQEAVTKEENQQWRFEPAQASDMASMRTNRGFSFQNVEGKRYMDLAGDGIKTKTKDGHIVLWDMHSAPDRYAQLHKSNLDGYYYVQQMHSKYVWDIEGGKTNNGAKLQLWDQKNTKAQQFKFIYADSAMTFKIENRGSGKYIDASSKGLDQNGCPVQIWDRHEGENQKWKLEILPEWYTPEKPLKVKVKVAYTNKYWDIEGPGSNAKVNGKKLQIWSMDNGEDRFFTVKKSGDYDWIWFEMDGGKRISVNNGQINVNRTGFVIWDAGNDDSQKYAIHPTSKNTCIIISKGWKAFEVRGGKEKINENGSDIILWDQNYGASQQFQLIDPATGQAIDFTK